MGATSVHISDELSDISGPLLLWDTWHTCTAMSYLTLADRYYYGTRGTRVGATSTHISEGMPDINGPLLLWGTWHARGCY
jgi:hypothetical protein